MEEPMDWIDVSVPLHEDMAVFTGDPRFHIERTSSMAAGAICNVSRMDLGVHTGTHVDAPVHFLDGGGGAETIPLDPLIGPAWVVDATAAGPTITAEDVEGFDIPAGEVRLMFRTRSANLWDAPAFDPAFVAPDATGAEAMVRRGVRLVGMDYLSVAPFGDPTPTHRVLLSAGVVVLEGLDLRAVTPGPYELLCLPLRIVGSDGAPARALLRRRG
jgi:arylformamidase